MQAPDMFSLSDFPATSENVSPTPLPSRCAYWMHRGCLMVTYCGKEPIQRTFQARLIQAGSAGIYVSVQSASLALKNGHFHHVLFFELSPQTQGAKLIFSPDASKGETFELSAARQVAQDDVMRFMRSLHEAQPHAGATFLRDVIRAIPKPAESRFIQNCQGFLDLLCAHLPKPATSMGFTPKEYPFKITFQNIIPVLDRGLWVTARIVDPRNLFQCFIITGPNGSQRVDHFRGTQRHVVGKDSHHHDIIQLSFFVQCDTAQSDQWLELDSLRFPWSIVVHLQGGGRLYMTPSFYTPNIAQARRHILRTIPSAAYNNGIVRDVLKPTLEPLTEALGQMNHLKDSYVYGPGVSDHDVAVIIPLYQNYDYIEMQCARFALEPTLKARTICYVLDKPDDSQQIQDTLKALAELYQLSIRLIVHKENFGYAFSCNSGARMVNAETLIFLNSDAFPRSNDWVSALTKPLKKPVNAGIVGCKLLHDDDTIQHGGVYFTQTLDNLMIGGHQREGMSDEDEYANSDGERLAVTGACFAMRKTLFVEIGGFNIDYVIGDFEDIDLCLRLRQAGHKIYYTSQVDLYHFQRQSMAQHDDYSNQIWQFNARLHELKWGKTIRELIHDNPAQNQS